MLATIIHAVVQSAPSPPQYTTLIYIVGALVTGGALQVGVTAYRRWTRGPIEDKQIIGQIVQGEMSGMKDLLAEYRIEVEVTKRQLEEYREQLGEVTRELARAQVRITRLEDELKDAKGNRAALQAELVAVTAERDGLITQRDALEGQAGELRDRVSALERFARRAHPEVNPQERPG